MSFQFIDLAVVDAIATITLNRPDKRNAFSDDMRSEFIEALEQVAADKAIRALVLTGAGKESVVTVLAKPNAKLGLIFLDVKRAAEAVTKLL